ncbi:uncharacterized protein PAC_09981 [Phialocephala subalpina]|uniref:F-box domain-containing protein n=1 Tax=Phialocephala subalpina TaxID=576137 RepID=A0A1L7X4Z9_9HELO|nr:uncharacterized protein PAC_09981 [Phialocephala subalpina]
MSQPELERECEQALWMPPCRPVLPIDDCSRDNNFLMKIPLEIRLEIYKHLLVTPSGNICQRQYSTELGEDPRKQFYALDREFRYPNPIEGSFDLSILRVCWAVRKESLNVFYESNTFYMEPLQDYRWSESTFSNSSIASWLSSKNIQRLALDLFSNGNDLEKQVGDSRRVIDIVAQWSKFQMPKSVSLIISADMLARHLSRQMSSSSALGYECSEFMLKYVEFMKYCSGRLSDVKSRKLVVFTPYRAQDSLRQIQLMTSKYDANRYLEDLHAAFGGEIWLDGTLSRFDGALLKEIPFPLNCRYFDKARAKETQSAVLDRQWKLDRLTKGHENGHAFIQESNEALGITDLESVRIKLELDTLRSILDKVEASTHEVNACFQELDEFLRKPGLTQYEMEEKVQEWVYKVDSKMSDIDAPDLAEWRRKIGPTIAPPDQVKTSSRPDSPREAEERALSRDPTSDFNLHESWRAAISS